MKTNRYANHLKKLFSLLIHIRILNLFVLLLALYLSAAYLFSQKKSLFLLYNDTKLHAIVWGSILSVAAGYLINYFYDSEKDRIGKPFTYQIKSFIKTHELLQLYLILNVLSLLLALGVSYKLFLFFIVYQFMIGWYCHKLSKIVLVNNVFSVLLSVFPFLGLLLHYARFDFLLLNLSLFLVFLLFLKEITKDLQTAPFDSLFNYKTLPNTYGLMASKFNFILLFILLIGLSIYLSTQSSLSFMRLYFIASAVIFILPMGLILKNSEKYSKYVEWFLKIWIFIGILSIILIKLKP